MPEREYIQVYMLRSLIGQASLTDDSIKDPPESDTVATWANPEDEDSPEGVAHTYLERELKFAVSGHDDIERRLKELEGTRARFIGVTRERNCVLDTDGDELKSRDERLRLREIVGPPGVTVMWNGPA